LRIEDTDRERSTKEYEQSIIDALRWLGLDWDDEVIRQSERNQNYRIALEQLLRDGTAFYCHHSQEELEAERKRQEFEKQAPRHECNHKNLPLGKEGGGIIRLAVNANSDRKIIFDDVIRGEIEFKAELLGDISIARSVSDPLYNFAAVVDDADMDITHVIRGEDHISNTPKQILVYEAFGKTPPLFAHLPLILAPDRSKLSKRHGAMAVVDYKKDYLPDALINFLGGLGYTFSKDVLSREEMIQEFELSKVHKSGAVFDTKKLNWINSQYMKQLTPSEFKDLTDLKIPDSAVPLITERLEKLSDVEKFSYLWQEPEYNRELLIWEVSGSGATVSSLSATAKIIKNIGVDDKYKLRVAEDNLAKEEFGGDRGIVYWPLRVSVTGQEKSPDPIEIVHELGKKETLKRIDKAIQLLEK